MIRDLQGEAQGYLVEECRHLMRVTFDTLLSSEQRDIEHGELHGRMVRYSDVCARDITNEIFVHATDQQHVQRMSLSAGGSVYVHRHTCRVQRTCEPSCV